MFWHQPEKHVLEPENIIVNKGEMTNKLGKKGKMKLLITHWPHSIRAIAEKVLPEWIQPHTVKLNPRFTSVQQKLDWIQNTENTENTDKSDNRVYNRLYIWQFCHFWGKLPSHIEFYQLHHIDIKAMSVIQRDIYICGFSGLLGITDMKWGHSKKRFLP